MEINAVTLHKLIEMIFEFQTIQQNITACDFLGFFWKGKHTYETTEQPIFEQ